MKGKQQWRTTAATSPSALEILAQEEAEDFDTRVCFKAPKQYIPATTEPWNYSEDWEEHKRQLREIGVAENDRHDHYVNEIAGGIEQNVNFIEVACHEYYNHGEEQGEFDILAKRRGNEYTYFEIKSSHCEVQVNKAYDQFMRAIEVFPKRTWQFVLCTPLPDNTYLFEDCTKEAYRRHKTLVREQQEEKRKENKNDKPKTHKQNYRRRH